jgi:Fe/S biogenesis protein NfuA
MGIINRLFRERKGEPAVTQDETGAVAPREGIPAGFKRDEPVLTVTDGAKERIAGVLQAQDPPVDAIRVSAMGPGRYAMNLEPDGNPAVDDTVLPYGDFRVFIDAQSLPFVEGATLDYLETFGGGGFKFTNPKDPGQRPKKEPPAGPEGAVWRQIQTIIDEEVNPAVAGHGGHITLIDVQGGTVFVEMGGGCQGCGMANVTLKHGIERILKDQLPHVEEVLDVTDHAEGRNPYYAPSTK